MEVAGTDKGTEAHRWMGPATRIHGGVSVLVMDPGAGQPTQEWTLLAEIVPVSWLWLAYVEDPLVQARAMLERAVDTGAGVYVVTSERSVRTALLVAAHQADKVDGVLVSVDRADPPIDEELRGMLRKRDVPVLSVRPDSIARKAVGADRFSLYRPEMVEALVQTVMADQQRPDRTSPAMHLPFEGDLKALADRLGRIRGFGWTTSGHQKHLRKQRAH